MSKPHDDYIFLFIGDRAFTLKDLGPAADMRIDKAMQSIIDQGLLGEEYVGLQWFEVIKSSGLKLEAAPMPEQILQHNLHSKYEAAMMRFRELLKAGEPAEEAKAEMERLRKDWLAAEKLCKP